MRVVLLAIAFIVALSAPAVVQPGFGTPVIAAAASQDVQPAPRDLNIDIDVNRGGGAWYANPVWIAIGAEAVILLVLLIVFAARSTFLKRRLIDITARHHAHDLLAPQLIAKLHRGGERRRPLWT